MRLTGRAVARESTCAAADRAKAPARPAARATHEVPEVASDRALCLLTLERMPVACGRVPRREGAPDCAVGAWSAPSELDDLDEGRRGGGRELAEGRESAGRG